LNTITLFDRLLYKQSKPLDGAITQRTSTLHQTDRRMDG